MDYIKDKTSRFPKSFLSEFIKDSVKIHESRGYSQGDYAIILCQKDDDTSYIDNLLWDSPISYGLDLNGGYYNLDNLDDNQGYVKASFEKVNKAIMDCLKDNCSLDDIQLLEVYNMVKLNNDNYEIESRY